MRALVFPGSVHNMMSAVIFNRVRVQPHSMNKRMRMADGAQTVIIGEVTKVAVAAEALTYLRTSLVVSNALFIVIACRPALEDQKSSCAFDREAAIFREQKRRSPYLSG